MIKLKDEIKRVEAVKGNVVPVSKQLYLNLLKEIKLLRFKAHVANDWNLPLKEKEKEKVCRDITELLFEFWNDQRKGAYKMAENKSTVKTETAARCRLHPHCISAYGTGHSTHSALHKRSPFSLLSQSLPPPVPG